MTATAEATSLEARWRAALALSPDADLLDSGVRELAEFFDIDVDAARAEAENAVAASRREWLAAPRDTPSAVLDFYRTTRSYVFEHVYWHATDASVNAGNVAILDHALARGVRRYLDFGGGVGANAILFARHGIAVTIADVSPSMLAFARWRLERRGLHADVVDLTAQALPDAGFDLATAIDVLEHLADPGRELARIARALRPGGLLVYNDCTGLDPERPMHIVPSLYPILRSLRRSGFRETPVPAELGAHAYRVAAMPSAVAMSNHSWGAYDAVRYGAPGRMASAMLQRWRRSRAAR